LRTSRSAAWCWTPATAPRSPVRKSPASSATTEPAAEAGGIIGLMQDQPDDFGPPSDDTVEMDPGRRWHRPGWLPSPKPGPVALVALVIGLVAGYVAGVSHGRESAAPVPAAAQSAS